MLWLSTSGRASKMVPSEAWSPLQSEISTSTVVRGVRPRMAAMVAANPPAPPSARSSRATLVITAWARPIRCDRLGHPLRLARVEGQRVAGVDQAEPAGPGAAVAVDHEGGGAVRPALVDVGAAGLLAHRDQVEVAQAVLEAEVLLAHAGLDPQPLGLALAQRDPGAGVDARPAQAPVERCAPALSRTVGPR